MTRNQSVAVIVESIRIAAFDRHRSVDVARSVCPSRHGYQIGTGRETGAEAPTVPRRRGGKGCGGTIGWAGRHSDLDRRTSPPLVLRMWTFTATQDPRRGARVQRPRKYWRTTRPLHASRSRARSLTFTTARLTDTRARAAVTVVPSDRRKRAFQLSVSSEVFYFEPAASA
jgi:hypothetical protein